MILLIDNYDSFTFNLVQVIQKIGYEPVVVRNDKKELFTLIQQAKKLIISPGPSRPENAGYCLQLLAKLPKDIPVLGVCLGHQILGYFAGAEVKVAPRIMHGKTSPVYFDQDVSIFADVPSPAEMCRYHSLLVYPRENNRLKVTAWTKENEVMGISYQDRPWFGVQFHPESVFSPYGPKIIENFLKE